MKKLFLKQALAVAIMLLSGIVSYAASFGKCGDNLTWTMDDAGNLVITGSGDMYDAHDPQYQANAWVDSKVKTVKFPGGLTSIGYAMFTYTRNLKELNLAGTQVKTIMGNAFRNSGITTVYLPSTLKEIRTSAFWDCSDIEVIRVDVGNTTYDSRNKCNAVIETATNKLIMGGNKTVIPSTVKIIGESAFRGRTKLTSLGLHAAVQEIHPFAYAGCTALKSAFIPAGVLLIGYNPFMGCENLEYINVDEKNTRYDSRFDCDAIIETQPATLIAGCSGTIIPRNILTIDEYAFDGINIESIYIPASVTTIKERAIHNCTLLGSITVDKKNSVYDSRDNCNAIIKTKTNELIVGCYNTVIPNGIKSIANYAFDEAGSLKDVIIPPTVTSIGDNAFRGTNITGLYLPPSITSIGNSAFAWNSDIKEIVACMTTPPTITKTTFSSYTSDKTKLIVPPDTKAKYQAAEYWKNFQTIEEGTRGGQCGDKAFWTMLNGAVNITGTGAMYDFTSTETAEKQWGTATALNIGEGITKIGNYNFFNCRNIKTVSFPSTLTTIGRGVFEYCRSIESIWIPKSVTSIQAGTFGGCSSVKLMYVEADNTVYDSRNDCNAIIKTADNELVAGCTVTVIPNTVTTIGGAAFALYSNLTKITIPGSVTKIKASAFRYTKLDELHVEATEPPACTPNTFYGVEVAKCKLYVPIGSIEKYKAADIWKDFIILAGVDDITADDSSVAVRTVGRDITISGAPDDALVEVYNTAGMTVYSGTAKTIAAPASGLYIVRVAGTTHKVAVK